MDAFGEILEANICECVAEDAAGTNRLKGECIRPGTPLTPEDARRLIQQYVDHYNTVRLHSAIGFVTPADMLAGRQKGILDARDLKLEEARRRRQLRRKHAA